MWNRVITSSEPWNIEANKVDRNAPITSKHVFPKRSATMIDGTEKLKIPSKFAKCAVRYNGFGYNVRSSWRCRLDCKQYTCVQLTTSSIPIKSGKLHVKQYCFIHLYFNMTCVVGAFHSNIWRIVLSAPIIKVIVNWVEWLWNPSDSFVICFCGPESAQRSKEFLSFWLYWPMKTLH